VLGVEREAKRSWQCIQTMHGHIQKSDKSVLRRQFFANCTTSATSTRLVGLNHLWPFLISYLGISKTASNSAIRVYRWDSFGSPKHSGRNQRRHFGCAFLGVH
jgi:hypothetical protein